MRSKLAIRQHNIVTAVVASAVFTLSLSGCSLCSPGYMDDYATVGGKWQRSDPAEGRVGSPFSDAITFASHSSIENNESYESYGEEQYEEQYDGEVEVETIYHGTGFDSSAPGSQGGEYYESSIEEVPLYEDLGEDW